MVENNNLSEAEKEAKNNLRAIEASLPEIRQIRFSDVTFSFHIMELKSLGIGEELVDLIRDFKKVLEPHLKLFNLPKLVRIIVWEYNPQSRGSSATFGGILPFLLTPYHICMNTNSLHVEELRFEEPEMFQIRLVQVFLHELAHFVTEDEEKADELAFDVLKKILRDKPNNLIAQQIARQESFEESLRKKHAELE